MSSPKAKLANLARLVLNGPLRCRSLACSAVAGKAGIEIGGPSTVFGKRRYLALYDKVSSLDCCDFRQDTTWAAHEKRYRFHSQKEHGRMYFCEGTNVSAVPDGKYEFLLSSHALEHFANPIRALKEWTRVVRPGGFLIIVLPHYLYTDDAGRSPTPVTHMIEDYNRGVGEDDLTHVEEVCAHRRDRKYGSEEEYRAMMLRNAEHRIMHHHVFDAVNSKELLEVSGLKVLAAEAYPPFHLFLVAQSPSR